MHLDNDDEKDDEKKMRKKKGDNLFPDAPAVTQLSAAEHCSVFTAFKLLIRKCQPCRAASWRKYK